MPNFPWTNSLIVSSCQLYQSPMGSHEFCSNTAGIHQQPYLLLSSIVGWLICHIWVLIPSHCLVSDQIPKQQESYWITVSPQTVPKRSILDTKKSRTGWIYSVYFQTISCVFFSVTKTNSVIDNCIIQDIQGPEGLIIIDDLHHHIIIMFFLYLDLLGYLSICSQCKRRLVKIPMWNM